MKRTVRIAACAALALSLAACGNTPQQREASAAAAGAVVGGLLGIAAGVAASRHSQPVYVQPVYVRPARVWQPYCWQSAVTGQWMGCWQ